MIDKINAAIQELEKKFDDLVLQAQEDMTTNHVDVRHLRHSITRLPCQLKSEHKEFIKEVKDDLKKAESVDDVFLIADEYWDFLNYTLLQHIIDRHASAEVNTEMRRFAQEILAFRKETSLYGFSKANKRKPKKANDEFKKLVSEHKIDWSTATLEDVEQFRNDICSELSLFSFSLQLAAVTTGSVVLTWLVPQSLVAHIQKAITLSSQTMRKHHVTQLTVDGFITYCSTAGNGMCSPTVTFSLQGSLTAIMHIYILKLHSCSNCTILRSGAFAWPIRFKASTTFS